MAKLKTDPITDADLLEYITMQSDFAFEIEVLKLMLSKTYNCDHGGTYTDRTTGKDREFDIRARMSFGGNIFRLAIECKNLKDNFPLLISCMPRRFEEAFNEVVLSANGSSRYILAPNTDKPPLAYYSYRNQEDRTIYAPDVFVGKSCDQVGRHQNTSEFISGDSEIYTKWAQALSSASDLVSESLIVDQDAGLAMQMSSVIPILVVPNGMLWAVMYDINGNITQKPQQVTRCPYFINLTYDLGSRKYTVSHLEILTLEGLAKYVDMINGDRFRNSFFNNHFTLKLFVKNW